MDFARKQLEKFGWKDGEGLGKESQGITAAIKPHLKTGKEGMGYDLSQELTDTWWTKAYSDSLSRINVNVKEGGEVGVKLVEEDEDGSPGENESRKIKKSKKKVPEYTEELRPMDKMRRRMLKANFTTFSKGGTLTNGEMNAEDSLSKDSHEDNLDSAPKYKTLNDEELFKACGGRTLHKAARFGHKLNGKLARIAAQEQIDSSSDRDSLNQNLPDLKVMSKNQTSSSKKRKRDKKQQIENAEMIVKSSCLELIEDELLTSKKAKLSDHEECTIDSTEERSTSKKRRKRKKQKESLDENETLKETNNEDTTEHSSCVKKMISIECTAADGDLYLSTDSNSIKKEKKRKKSKNKRCNLSDES